MLQNLLFLPFIIFVIIAFIIFYRSMKTKPKKIAVIVIAILLPFHYYFYYEVYVENLVSQPLNLENQEYIKKLYNEYLNNDGQITYREVRIISLKISNLARYEK